MSEIATTCSGASIAAGETLAGTAVEGARWLLVEVRGPWGRDAVGDTELPAAARAALEAVEEKVIFIRRPDRRSGVTLLLAHVDEQGGTVVRQELESLDEVVGSDVGAGEPVAGPIVLVCAHGRRDACCARLGPPLYESLRAQLAPEHLWQCSHLGGHRFAPNVLVLPYGVQLGRIPVERAAEVVGLLADRRIPLDLYRGRTIFPPPVQAAETLVRSVNGLDGLGDLRLVGHEDGLVTFSTPAGEVQATVEQRPGPVVPVSCGAEPEPTSAWVARLESPA